MKVKKTVAKAKARAKVFEKSKYGNGRLCPQTQKARPKKQMDVDHYLQRGSHQKQRLDEYLPPEKTDIVEVLCNWIKHQSAPDVGLDVFDDDTILRTGREENWGSKREREKERERERERERDRERERERVTHLIKCTKGDLKEIIKHCVQQTATVGYNNDKELL